MGPFGDSSMNHRNCERVHLFPGVAACPYAHPSGRRTVFSFKLIDELTRLRTLSTAFRAYWQQQLMAFIELNPWKWGLPLTPSLAIQKASLESISSDEIDKRQWLSSVEQISPSVQLTEHFRIASKTNLVDEARGLRHFLQFGYARNDEPYRASRRVG